METESFWIDDRLGRAEDAAYLRTFIPQRIAARRSAGRTASFVLNINAGWGNGKTFFLDRFARQLRHEGHLVASVNAWRDDHAPDPMVAIMSAIDKAAEPYKPRSTFLQKSFQALRTDGLQIAARTALAVAKQAAKRHIGDSEIFGDGDATTDTLGETGANQAIDEFAAMTDARANAMIDDFRKTSASIEKFKQELAEALTKLAELNVPMPLYVLVDELDRCRPPYAILLLERVKHLFEVEQVAFVFATDTEQLQHSIVGAYGANFDAFRYLKRFFDATYEFEPALTEAFAENLIAKLDLTSVAAPTVDYNHLFASAFSAFGLTLRECDQVVDIIDFVITNWHRPAPVDLVYLILCAVAVAKNSKIHEMKPERWKIRLGSLWRDGQTDEVSAQEYGNAVRSASRDPVDYLNHSPQSQSDHILRPQFLNEMQGRRLMNRKGIPSVQHSVPELVRRAGRLIIPDLVAD